MALYKDEENLVNHERVEDETLAAFLDGTLPAGERAAVLRVLAANPEAYAEFLDAASVAAAVNADSTGGSGSATSPRRWRRSMMLAGPLLAAAGIAGVILVARGPRAPDTIDLMQGAQLASAAGSGSVDATLGNDWDQPGWSVVRGGAAGTASAGTAARIGARVAQLEYAAAASDSAAWQRVAATLADLVTSVEGSGPLTQQLRSGGILDLDQRATLARQLRELTGTPAAFDVGAWLETARLAAASNRLDHFRAGGDALTSLQRVTAAIEREQSSAEWSVIISQLKAIETEAADASRVRLHVDSAMSAFPR
jgi:hypothetical protein